MRTILINWQDPVVLAQSARAFVLLVHTLFGTYAWEVIQSLDFDWLVISGRKKLNGSIMIYWLARYATLLSLIVGIRICNAYTDIDCQTWNYILHTCAYCATGFLSGLLYLRVVAVSGRNKIVIAGLGLYYVAYWGMVAFGIYHSEAVYIPELFLCASIGLHAHQANTLVQFSFDVTCLVLMIYFLLRNRQSSTQGSLWNFLVQQGAVYCFVIVVAYLLAAIFLSVNVNDAVAQMPNVFALTINAISATRMQRALVTFYDTPKTRTWAHSSAGDTPSSGGATGRAPPRGINVTVDVEHNAENAYPMRKYPGHGVNSMHDELSKDDLGAI